MREIPGVFCRTHLTVTDWKEARIVAQHAGIFIMMADWRRIKEKDDEVSNTKKKEKSSSLVTLEC